MEKAALFTDHLPVPTPGPGQALVRVRFAALDPLDCKLLSGALRARFPVSDWPFVPGFDAVGTVERLGPDCDRFNVGDNVVVCTGLQESCCKGTSFGPAGAAAEFCVCPETQMSRAPEGVSEEALAGLPLSGLSAYQALFTGGGLSTAGGPLGSVGIVSKVLVLGGNRGAGHLAVQMAKSAGAVVTATVPPSCLDWMYELGADHAINFMEEDWVEALKGQDFDLILDCVGWATSVREMDRASAALRSDGKYISLAEFDAFEGVGERYTRQFKAMVPKACAADLDVLIGWVLNGELQVSIDRVCPFRDLRHALYECRDGQCRGKVLVSVQDVPVAGVEGGA